MGIVWHDGSMYIGPHGVVLWSRLANRPANNFTAMYTAAYLRLLATIVSNPDLPIVPDPPDPAWGPYGDLRVMAWNGGASDRP